MSPLERVQKILSKMGVTSRRKAEEWIREGRVRINGRPARIGDKADPAKDHIRVDGRRIFSSSSTVYILLNKPKKTMTTAEDPEGRRTVFDFLAGEKPRLFPVGRLDYDTEGVLLLTNDGEMAHRLAHPSSQVPRTYWVKLKGKPTREEIRQLSRGITLEDGRTAPCRIIPLRESGENLWVEMVLREGRNRQVKRMWEKTGYPVLKLKRVEFAGLTAKGLAPGQSRFLHDWEVRDLKKFLRGKDGFPNRATRKEGWFRAPRGMARALAVRGKRKR
jgi:23S rRNA pseudouridine2605 synthase